MAALLSIAISPAVGRAGTDLELRGVFAAPMPQSSSRVQVQGILGEPFHVTVSSPRVELRPGFRSTPGVTDEAIAVRLLAPNGGETFGTGNLVEIRWERTGGGENASVDLEYTTTEGSTWITIARAESDDGVFAWTAPPRPSDSVRVRVLLASGGRHAADESDAVFSVVDDDGPTFTLGAFPNPYLSSFVDLFVVADEPLDPATLRVEIDGVSVSPRRIEGPSEVWWLDDALGGLLDSAVIVCCAADARGNEGCFQAGLVARAFAEGTGGDLASSAGDVVVRVRPSGPTAAEHARTSPAHRAAAPAFTGSAAAGLGARWWILATHESGAIQVIAPESPAGSSSASIEIDARARFPDESDLSRVLVVGEDGPLDSWFDPASGRVGAPLRESSGRYHVRLGDPGSSRIVDPDRLSIRAVGPNPFVQSTVIRLEIGAPRAVQVEIFDARGRRIANLGQRDVLAPGEHAWTWDGRTEHGHAAPAGTYFVRIRDHDRQSTAKIVRLR